jgi:hypothetical protein
MTAETAMAVGHSFPLLFTFREVLLGNGVLVEIKVSNGRALCVHEEDGYWIYGVNPGGMAAYGVDADGARGEFRAAFSGIMREIANECDSFDAHVAAVNEFVADTNRGYETDWKIAVEAVKHGDVKVDGLESLPAETPMTVEVSIKPVEQIKTTDNEADFQLELAA